MSRMNKFTKNARHIYMRYIAKTPLAWRIIAWYSLFLIMIFVLLSSITIHMMNTWEHHEINYELEHEVIKISRNIDHYELFSDDVYIILYNNDGEIIRGYIPEEFSASAPVSFDSVVGYVSPDKEFTYYYMDAPFTNNGISGYVRGIIPATVANRHMRSMSAALAFAGIFFIILASLGGYAMMYVGLSPIRKLTNTAKMIGQKQNFSERVETLNSSYELSQLSNTFNFMLDSLEKSLLREKQFSSDVSHELRTPIAVIQLECDYARKYTESVDEAKESFEAIFQRCKNMSLLVNQLLELSRLDAKAVIDLEPVNISILLSEVLSDHKQVFAAKEINFESNIQSDVIINGNYTLLRRAFSNLLSNSIKYTKSKINVSLEENDDNVVVSFSDNGIGIPKKCIPKIWDRLYQVDEARTHNSEQGFGLGLHFVKMIAQVHRAQAKLESEPNVATCFSLVFPKYDEDSNTIDEESNSD